MIEKLLVANRGEIARRVMRSAHSMGISCVAVFSDADAASAHVGEADESVRLPGQRASDTYLRIDAIVDAALRSGCDAVHPGYGFLSENAQFARACESAGLVFVGPPSSVIEAMGSKLSAKATMSSAGVPVLPSVSIPTEELAGTELARDGILTRTSELGWPLLVKASAGGGGRGMRIVDGPEDLEEAVTSARREATSAFGDGTVFLEPYVTRPRHVEVQIFGDTHGNVVHLYERECSIQRRHQKIVEEAPSPSVDPGLRSQLGEAALRAARAVGYVNAGTVEFLMLEDRSFAFLEINTRLQVEHTVTEMVTGLDLVRLQLLVADGQPLPPDVFDVEIRGHAIETRIYAEDPTSSWQPSAGRLQRFRVPGARGRSGADPDTDARGEVGALVSTRIRVDSGVEEGSVVTTHYDPLLAKVIAHSPSRQEAANALSRTLELSQIHGLVTNRDLLVRILRHPEFVSGDFDTGFLERHDPALLGAPLAGSGTEQLHALAAALASQAERRTRAPVLADMPSGWRNVQGELQHCSFKGPRGTLAVAYRFDRSERLVLVEIDGSPRSDITLVSCLVAEVVLEVRGITKRYRVERSGADFFVDGPDGSSALRELERFGLPGSQLQAGSLVAPLPGTVVTVVAEVGAKVTEGDLLAAIEAMKMEHEVRASFDGTVTCLNVSPGQQVEAGEVLVVVEPDNETP